VVAPLLAGGLGFWLGAAGLVVVFVVCAAGLGWSLGRLHQVKLDERLHLISVLEPFTEWAEQALADAPEQLDPETEDVRRRLQADYQAAQALLERLRR
jgi:hypothetical protein